jgi:hypothetical protein
MEQNNHNGSKMDAYFHCPKFKATNIPQWVAQEISALFQVLVNIGNYVCTNFWMKSASD